jgi:hypothetical protein
MVKTQFSALTKKPSLLLGLILAAFLCREAFLVTLFPLFTGQDEARHYNTIQWLTEEQPETCERIASDEEQNKEDLGTYRFSQEIRETSTAANLGIWREENYRKPEFSAGSIGSNESDIKENNWTRTMTACPPDIAANARHFSLFHWAGSLIEKSWADTDVLTRFYLIRLIGILLGALTVALAYFASVEAGLSYRASLLIAFILSLQPKLSVYTTNINYDAILIPCFSLFTFAGLHLLKRGITPWNALLLILTLTGATLTKGTGLILFGGLVFLIAWTLFYHGKNWWQKLTRIQWFIGIVLIIGAVSAFIAIYSVFSLFPNFHPASLLEYLEKSVPKIPSSSKNFWGTISWTTANHSHWFVWIIWIVEAIALLGLFRFFREKSPSIHLPTKATVLFLLTLFFSLQFGIRLHDWHVFQETGSLALGTPGRYFLPTLLPQLLLMAIGIGTLLKQSLFFERSLLLFTALILAFHLYTTWLIIIPRFYL